MKTKFVIILAVATYIVLSACKGGESTEAATDSASPEMMVAADMAPPPPPASEAKSSVSDEKSTSEKKDATVWKRSDKTINSFEVFVGDKEKLELKGSQVYIKVDGFRARVVIDCFFYNQYDFNREGTFKMKLPAGASPYYFAFGGTALIDKDADDLPYYDYDQRKEIDLSPAKMMEARNDSWIQPREAKIVPKEKAAFAYQNTVRQSVDPALMEWAGADVFNCRVFPLEPNKIHRIVIGYDINLTQVQNNKSLDFPIPHTDATMVVDVDVAKLSGADIVVTPKASKSWEWNRRKFHFENPEVESISIQYKNNSSTLLVDKTSNDEQYFAASLLAPIPASQAVSLPSDVVFLLDVSLSSNPDKFNVWLQLMESILKNNQKSIKNFAVLGFNIETFWWKKQFVANTDQNVRELKAYCNNIALMGASDVSQALREASHPQWLAQNKSKLLFLLTDGSITWGENAVYSILAQLNPSDRLFAYNTGMPQTDLNNLQILTRETHGSVFSVTGDSEIAKASVAHQKMPWELVKVVVPGCSDVIVEGRPQYIYQGQNLILAGRGVPNDKSIQLWLRQNNKTITVTVPVNAQISSPLAKRVYGCIATNQLEEFGLETEKYSTAYACHFTVPGKTCSLLMLESEEDYAQYNISDNSNLFTIKSNPVAGIIEKTIANFKQYLGDAKQLFVSWLKKLGSMPGMEVTIPLDVESVIEQLPKESFTIPYQSFAGQMRMKDNLPYNVLRLLEEQKVEYDNFVYEAQKISDKHDALRLLSSLVENNPSDGVLCRDIAFTAMEWGFDYQAYFILRNVLYSRPYEPQSYHAIAQTLTKMNRPELAVLYYEIALNTKWDDRFGQFTDIAALDYMKLLRDLKNKGKRSSISEYVAFRLKSLEDKYPETKSDLMVTMFWNTDNTDIDLHVIEPSGEECYYGYNRTKSGGQLTRDVTRGYGPEMYIMPDAEDGTFKIFAHYYASNRNLESARTKIYTTVYKHWGTSKEEITRKTTVLDDTKDKQKILYVDFD